VQDDSGEAAEGDEDGFGDFLPQQAEGDDGDRSRRQVGDGLAGEHDECADDRAGRGCGGSLDEGLDLRVVAVPDRRGS
jgi:hypothetical protein